MLCVHYYVFDAARRLRPYSKPDTPVHSESTPATPKDRWEELRPPSPQA